MREIAMLMFTLVLVASVWAQDRGRGAGPAVPPMTLTVQGFADGGEIPVRFSQAAPGAAPGEGTSPAMTSAGGQV